MNRTELRQTLASLELSPSRRLGQNFLHDANLARWIVDQLELTAEEHLVEVGPGLGALTSKLPSLPGGLTLIERDARLAEFLRDQFPEAEILCADAARVEFQRFFPRQPVSLLGNLPYSAASAILMRAGDDPSPFRRMIVTVQKEMADRMVATPDTTDYGAFTLQLAFGWKVRTLKTLSGSVFWPEPKVASAVVLLEARSSSEWPDCDPSTFRELVRKGFSQRRKQLGKLLGCKNWEEVAGQLGVPGTVRAESLRLDQWIQLAQWLGPADEETAGAPLQVVNSRDEPVGETPRQEVHARNLLHRAVHLFLFDPAGRLYLQKRSRWKDLHAGAWDSSAAGHVDSGEDYQICAHRELQEELGVETDLVEAARVEACPETGWEFVRLYFGNCRGKVRPAYREIEAGAWFDLETVEEWVEKRPQDFAPGFLKCWEAAQPSIPKYFEGSR